MGRQAEAIGRALRKEIATAAKSLVLQIARELRLNPSRGGTPVDTGHARASWIPSIGQPSSVEASAASSAEYESGVVEVLGYVLEKGPLWVTNNAPYIQRLNYGYSEQAPALFVEAAIDRAITKVEERFGSGAVGFTRGEFQSAVGAAGASNLAGHYTNLLGGDGDD